MKPAEQELENWIRRINEQDMPIFAATVSRVISSLNSDDTSAGDIAESVLSDASLTGNVLKMANTVYYNPSHYKITTVTRAVMVLGFERIRNLVLSVSLIDALRHDVNKKELADVMAYSFHAAVQAKELAILNGHRMPEGIFISTLLSHVGELVFWAFSEDKGVELRRLIKEEGWEQKKAEYQVLGFHLSRLTDELLKMWSLDELLKHAVTHDGQQDESAEFIQMGHKIADISRQGWNSQSMDRIVAMIAQKIKKSESTISALIQNNARIAKNMSYSYGLIQASMLIPQSQSAESDQEEGQGEDACDVMDNIMQQDTANEIDYATQLAVLQEITETIEEKPKPHIIIEMVLEGICRGLAMDRAQFAILSQDKKSLVFRYALGNACTSCAPQQIDISSQAHPLNAIIQSKKGKLIESVALLDNTEHAQLTAVLGSHPFVVMPTIVKNKVIGLFFADRCATERKISEQDFLFYQGFCQQVNMGLTFLAIQD